MLSIWTERPLRCSVQKGTANAEPVLAASPRMAARETSDL
jgi:hypothetical protein